MTMTGTDTDAGTKTYIGSKLIDAWPKNKDGKEGYGVRYEDGYISWSPKDVFEKAYRIIDGKFISARHADTIRKVLEDLLAQDEVTNGPTQSEFRELIEALKP